MSKQVSNLDEFTIGELSSLIWCVRVDVKPAAEICVHPDKAEDFLKYIEHNHPEIKTVTHKAFGESTMIIVYMHDHVKRLVDEAFRVRDIDREMYHILLGYVFGIPTRNIQDFLTAINKE